MVMEGATQGLGTEAVEFLLELLEQEPPKVSGAVVADAFSDAGRRLIYCGALRAAANASVVTCRACDADHPAEVEFDGAVHGYRHFCPEVGWVKVETEDLKQYLLDVSWLLRQIARAMKMRPNGEPRCLVDDVLWDVGDARIGNRDIAVLFGRRLDHCDNLDCTIDALTSRIGRPPGILLSTTDRLSRHIRLPGHHRFLPLRHCMVAGASEFEIDQEMIKGVTGGAIRREGFSTGYRTAFVGGIEYKFSKKQAAIIEALDNAGGPVHKDELLAAADTDQTDLIQVFRSKGKAHPAWGVLIHHDNQGNYFLRR